MCLLILISIYHPSTVDSQLKAHLFHETSEDSTSFVSSNALREKSLSQSLPLKSVTDLRTSRLGMHLAPWATDFMLFLTLPA